MASLNKVMLIGRLTDNPQPARTIGNGSQVISFRFAVGRSKKNPQTGQWENDPNPLYIDCEAWSRPDNKRNLVDVIQRFCKKGEQIYLEGRLQYEMWDDKNNPGVKRSKHKIVIDNLELLGSKPGGDSGGMGAGSGEYDNDMDAPPPARGPAPRAAGARPAAAPARNGYTPPPEEEGGDEKPEGGEIPF